MKAADGTPIVARYVDRYTKLCTQSSGSKAQERYARFQKTLIEELSRAELRTCRGVWRCFHCDEVFDTPGGARDHFGAVRGDTPGCLLKVQLGDERGWLMVLRKEQEAHRQQLDRALEAEREVERLECRVASLSSDMKFITPFAKCDSMRDVFNVYDSMEGRALAAEERERVLREALSAARVHIADCDCINSACGEDCIYKFIDAALATPAPAQPAQPSAENGPQCG